jgi:hypothetical protein
MLTGSDEGATLEITLATELAFVGSHKKLAAPLNKINPIKVMPIMTMSA